MIDDPFVLIDPPSPLPAALAVVMRQSKLPLLKEIEKSRLRRRYAVRANLSDHIPLAGSLSEILSRPSSHLLFVAENPLTIYLHQGGKNAVFLDLMQGEAEKLKCVQVQVESRFPSNTFLAARTAINCFLDSLMRVRWFPATIARLDLHIAGENEALCHQLQLPFDEGLRLGPLGGIHQFPALASYESVVREAINTTSPFYRLLCAYRLYEGLQPLRHWLRQIADKLQVLDRLPKSPQIDPAELRLYGFSQEFLEGLRTTDDVWKKMKEHRNSVAHFLTNKSSVALPLFDGRAYHEYSLCGAFLLKCAYAAFRELWLYFSTHLNGRLTAGSVLPLIEQRDAFILRPDTV